MGVTGDRELSLVWGLGGQVANGEAGTLLPGGKLCSGHVVGAQSGFLSGGKETDV